MTGSTRETISNDIPSRTGVIETVLAVLFYWWFAIHFETYLLLLMSLVAAPLVLLRSDRSVEEGATWFGHWEKTHWVDKEDPWPFTRGRRLIAVILCTVLLGSSYGLLFSYFSIDEHAYWRALGLGFFICWISSITAFILAFITTGIATRTSGTVGSIASLAAMAGVLIGTLFQQTTGAAVGAAVFIVSHIAVIGFNAPLIVQIFFIPLMIAWATYALIVGLGVRITATLKYLPQGLRALPDNFRRLTLCTSPIQEPEFVPGLPTSQTEFIFGNLLKRLRYEWSQGRRRHGAVIFLLLAAALWFFPAWLYRISLKSTAWFWWPLYFLSRPPKLAASPDWFHEQVMEAKWARRMRPVPYITILIFIGVSLWQTINEGTLPENPFLNVVGYTLSIKWSTTPWQMLGVLSALLSIAIVHLVDWNFRKYRIAKKTKDANLAEQALRHFAWTEYLMRFRVLVVLCYWIIVGVHAGIYFNSTKCWFALPGNVQSWANWIYRYRYPDMQACHQAVPRASR